MVGIILAGGNGTRLRPLTNIVNKHLLPVYDKPMIFYPLQTLKKMGCDKIVIVSGGENIGGFAELLQDGVDLGVDIIYRVQREAGGIAQALKCAEGLTDTPHFPVILGDNYFGDNAPTMRTHPTIFTKSVPDPERFGVYHNGKIIEKPTNPLSDQAVVGLYIYDSSVFDVINDLSPSARGEYEVTDINNHYLSLGGKVEELNGDWIDMGTFDSLLEVANKVSNREVI